MPDEEEQKGKVVEFPAEGDRMPPPRLPGPVGRIATGHPLLRPLAIALILLAILLAVQIVSAALGGGCRSPENKGPTTFTETYREPGTITYQGSKLRGWFLDSRRQHFMAEDGRRFTYVDSHERESSTVSGHWRLME